MGKVFLKAEQIKTDGLQMRSKIDMDTVREYAEDERERGVVFPALVVFKDKAGVYWLADGFHRLGAYRQNAKEKIACDVHEGEYVDAVKYALKANAAHGLKRSSADKAQAVLAAYKHRKILGLPDVPAARVIAELAGVSHDFAGIQLATVASWRSSPTRTGADGRERPASNPPPPWKARPESASAELKRGMQEAEMEHEAQVYDEAHRGGPPPPRKASSEPPPVRGSSGTPPPPAMAESLAPGKRKGPVLPLDERGKAIPPALTELWNRRSEVSDLARMVSDVRVALRKAQEAGDPLWHEINYSSVLADLDMAFAKISQSKPWCVCTCQGIGCKVCKDRGLVSKYRFDNSAPRELK